MFFKPVFFNLQLVDTGLYLIDHLSQISLFIMPSLNLRDVMDELFASICLCFYFIEDMLEYLESVISHLDPLLDFLFIHLFFHFFLLHFLQSMFIKMSTPQSESGYWSLAYYQRYASYQLYSRKFMWRTVFRFYPLIFVIVHDKVLSV